MNVSVPSSKAVHVYYDQLVYCFIILAKEMTEEKKDEREERLSSLLAAVLLPFGMWPRSFSSSSFDLAFLIHT